VSSLTLGLENIVFHSELLIELDQEDRVMKHNTSGVMEHNLSLQGAMSPNHGCYTTKCYTVEDGMKECGSEGNPAG
jgi:hypothetical protein